MLDEKKLKEKFQVAKDRKEMFISLNTDKFIKYVENLIEKAVERAEKDIDIFLNNSSINESFRKFEEGFSINIDIQKVVSYFMNNYQFKVSLYNDVNRFDSTRSFDLNKLEYFLNPIGQPVHFKIEIFDKK